MNWIDLKKIIRRYLRDPDGNIWDSAILKRLWNDEQADICMRTGLLEKIKALRVPPMYGSSYQWDWEWAYRDTTGKAYQCSRYHQQSDMIFTFLWESQQLGYTTGSESDYGDQYTHPFEAWHASSLGKPVSIWFPEDFRKTRFIAWDRDPLAPSTLKEISSQDPSWHTRSGVPINYFRVDDLSNEFYLYPHASTPVFDDVEGDKLYGMEIFDDTNTESAEVGVIMDITGNVFNIDEGLSWESIVVDDNLLLIYEAQPEDIETEFDEGSLPGFLQKYCRYAVLERAYSMNTDGKIESLRDYWGWRKKLGMEAIKALKRKRRTDRDYQLTTKTVGGRRNVKHPRLPDTYPAVF